MKKCISVWMVFCLVLTLFGFAGCSQKNGTAEGQTDAANTVENGEGDATVPTNDIDDIAEEIVTLAEADIPVIEVNVDKTTVAPGESFTAVLHIDNTRLLTSITAMVGFDESVVNCSDFVMNTDSDFNQLSNQVDGQVVISGFVLTTVDFMDTDMATMTFTVNETASAGDKITLSPSVPELKLGTDATGDTVYDVASQLKLADVTITVA